MPRKKVEPAKPVVDVDHLVDSLQIAEVADLMNRAQVGFPQAAKSAAAVKEVRKKLRDAGFEVVPPQRCGGPEIIMVGTQAVYYLGTLVGFLKARVRHNLAPAPLRASAAGAS